MMGRSGTRPQSGLGPGSKLNAAASGRHAAAHHGATRARHSPKPSTNWLETMLRMKNSTIAARNGSASAGDLEGDRSVELLVGHPGADAEGNGVEAEMGGVADG